MEDWGYDFKYDDETDVKEISVYLSMLSDECFRLKNSYEATLE
jgi:hypothetical protein